MSRIFSGTSGSFYFIRCEACGERQVLEFPRNLNRSGELVCLKCAGPMRPDQEGEWVAEHPSAAVKGYHVNKLYSPRADLETLASTGYAIEDGLVSDVSTIQQFKNQDLGMPYAPEGGSVTDEMLDACERTYDFPSPIVGHPVVMGVDVGAVLHVTIKCREKDDDPDATRLIYAATTSEWGELDRLMQLYKVQRCVIDGMPEDGKSMAFAKRWPGRAYVAFYPDMNRWGYPEAHLWKADKPVVLIHRTRAFDSQLARIIGQKEHLPKPVDGRIRGYRAQIKAPVRVITQDGNGRDVARWDERNAADHWAHSSVYATAAWEALRGYIRGAPTSYSVTSSSAVDDVGEPLTDEQKEAREDIRKREQALLACRRKIDAWSGRPSHVRHGHGYGVRAR